MKLPSELKFLVFFSFLINSACIYIHQHFRFFASSLLASNPVSDSNSRLQRAPAQDSTLSARLITFHMQPFYLYALNRLVFCCCFKLSTWGVMDMMVLWGYTWLFTNTTIISLPNRRMSLGRYHSCGDNHGIRPPNPEQYLTPLQQKEVAIRHLKTKLLESENRVCDRLVDM